MTLKTKPKDKLIFIKTNLFIGIFLFLITLVAIFVRVWSLGILPWGFHVDELDAGYIGRYILLHGKDIYGHPWPLVFDKFGDFRPTGIFYLSGLSTYIFGINEFAVRLPGALFGALSVIAIYFLTNYLFKSKLRALCVSGILTVMPWHIVLSRATSEAIIGLFLVIIGLALIIKGLIGGKSRYLFSALLILGISYFFYHSFRILVPLIVFPFIFYPNISNVNRKIMIGTSAILLIFSLGLSFTSSGRGRLTQVAFWQNPILPNKFMSLTAGDGPANVLVARTFHNKIIIYSREFITQYLSYFSPDFLFVKGGLPDRYVVPEQGVFLLIFIPLLIAGLIALIKINLPVWTKLYVFGILLISPLPAALTYEDAPNVHRAIMLILPYTLIIGLGLAYNIELFKKINFRSLSFGLFFSIFIIGEFTYFSHQYIYHSPEYKSLYRNDGTTEMMLYVISHRQSYTKILMSTYFEHPLYYLFYANKFSEIPPGTFTNVLETTQFDNIYFVKNECPSKDYIPTSNDKVLIIDGGDCISRNSILIKSIQRRDSTFAYRILEPLPISN